MPVIKSGAFIPWCEISATHACARSFARIYSESGQQALAEEQKEVVARWLPHLQRADSPPHYSIRR